MRRRRIVIVAALLLAALALRIGEVERSPYRPKNDAVFYLRLAKSVARTGDYPTVSGPGTGSNGTSGPTALFPPAFPYFLAFVDVLDGHPVASGPVVAPDRLSQAALGTVAVGLTGLVALEAFGEVVGLVALALAAFYPVMIETSSVLLSENLVVVFELAALWAALRIRRSGRPYAWMALTGVFTGLAVLTHQNALVLVVPVAVAAWSAAGAGRARRRRLIAPAVVVAAAVLTVAPWTVRNAVDVHSFIPVSDQAGETILGTYNSTAAHDPRLPYRWFAIARVGSAQDLLHEAPQLAEPAWEGRLLSRGLSYIGDHPLSPVLVAFHNTVRMLDLDGSYAWQGAASAVGIQLGTARIAVLSLWLVAILALAGAFTSYARAAPRWLWLAPLLYALSVVFVRMETPRFREPLDPFLIMLAACALTAAIQKLRRRAPVRGEAGAAVAVDAGERVEVGEGLS